jgi:hypothetical protein
MHHAKSNVTTRKGQGIPLPSFVFGSFYQGAAATMKKKEKKWGGAHGGNYHY